MSLAGGLAGLFAWALAAVIAAALTNQPDVRISDLLAVILLGAFIGGLGVAFSDRYAGRRISAKWVFFGMLIGLLRISGTNWVLDGMTWDYYPAASEHS